MLTNHDFPLSRSDSIKIYFTELSSGAKGLIIGCVVVLIAASAAVAQVPTPDEIRRDPPTENRQESGTSRYDPCPQRDRCIYPIQRMPNVVQDSLKIPFKIVGASNRRIRVKVDGEVDAATSKELLFSPDDDVHEIIVNLFQGQNRITLIGFVDDEPSNRLARPIDVYCEGRYCHKPYSLSPTTVAHLLKKSAARAQEENDSAEESERREHERRETSKRRVSSERRSEASREGAEANQDPAAVDTQAAEDAEDEESNVITIDRPKPDSTVKDVASVDAYLTITKDSNITKIQYDVKNNKETFVSDPIDVSYPAEDKPAELVVKVRVLKGTNTIRFVDPDHPGNLDHQAFTVVNCEGERCSSDFLVSDIPSNSQNTRAVVGFEQAGASSTSSKTKPFLDFYFSTPFVFSKQSDEEKKAGLPRVPRVAAWGNIRFSTTPVQTATAAAFPSNLVNQVGNTSGSIVDLVQSFDFLAGLEARIFSANGSFLSLIPGVRQKTRFYIAAGGGAISPLSANREAAQIFRIPEANTAQRALFEERFGVPPTGKTFIGFVPLERDRFFRQFYAGLRLKTLYCDGDDEDCERPLNRFPGIVDFMIGQNEAVTGGRLKYDVRDSENNIIGHKRSYVLRVDAFYPFPIRAASFLYLYGTAMLKIGAGGVKITNPLFLDTAPGDVLITDSTVFIPPPEKQPSQLDRDYYKIGVGVNLTDLFNRNRQPPN